MSYVIQWKQNLEIDCTGDRNGDVSATSTFIPVIRHKYTRNSMAQEAYLIFILNRSFKKRIF